MSRSSKRTSALAIAAVCLLVLLAVCGAVWYLHSVSDRPSAADPLSSVSEGGPIGLDNLPPFTGQAYVALNDNQPLFTKAELVTESYENYAPLDELGRCGVTVACIGRDLMPTEPRGNIGQVKPSGWQTTKYDIVDGKYLYNRCHLIGFQLTGENANRQNLITGTRFMNTKGMLPFENMVADYIKETGNHVLYRVTPIFEGDDLVAKGVTMEARSVEDDGEGICLYVYVYNCQPGVVIDYATGDSRLQTEEERTAGSTAGTSAGTEAPQETYILNTGTQKFHKPSCGSVESIRPENRKEYTGSREELLTEGYAPCGSCKP